MRTALTSLLAAIAMLALPTSSIAADDTLVSALEQRLAGSSVEAVNAYLASQWSAAMVPFNRKTAACELPAVSLAVRLSRSADARAAQAHTDALRSAVGQCTGFVLALAAVPEVPRYCASIASWTAGQTARELRRRIAAIEANELLRSSQSGKSCRAAYLYELHNTRVVLRSRPS